ncbi:MAG TPA: EAL domain-containing protein [Polyangia bacterium]|jgi:EAL domain-containing protein (putative c-di-GMP-specific phosphodiesterase class I)|nr:EAL domain-containing protein [Polyangia bacterium]
MRDRILLVDDEPALLRVLARSLSTAGFDVDTAGDGSEAIEAFEAKEFDLVISDITMPRMNGIELLRAVRARNIDIPVVLMTASPLVESAMEAVEYGATRYLSKPVDTRALVTTAERAVHLHKIARLKRQATEYLGDNRHEIGELPGLDASFGRALQSLWMAFQPIVSWSGHTVFGYEALVRTDEKELPFPDTLLAAAERLFRLSELGRTIRGRSARALDGIPAQASLFVNLHTRDLLDDSLLSADAALSRHADRVVLEVTERASLDEVKDVRRRVAALRALGYRVAIDDLGAGYAGLNSFAYLEPDIVKIDMALVRDVDREPTKRKLIGSLTKLCADLGIVVIAEGIERTEERDVLVDLGCDLLQGFLFARPGREFPAVAW